MASWLVYLSQDRAVLARALASWDIVWCPWERLFTLTEPVSTTQVFKCVPEQLMLGGNPVMD